MVGIGSLRRVRWQRSARFLALAMALLCSAGGLDAALGQPSNEYEVKAAFLYNFAKFVQWPPQAFASEDAGLALCVLGDDPFRGVLEKTVAGKKVHGHEIVVRHVTHDAARHCHILFVSVSGRFRSRATLAAVSGSHVLTVGDDGDFANQGGMIAFRLDGNKVRFVINTDAAAKAGIEISSQLLKVAANIIAAPAIAP